MADNAPLYRAILDVFAASKRQFRLHLRPDDVLAEATWPGGPPTPETVQQALGLLVDWGNLQSQPQTRASVPSSRLSSSPRRTPCE
jgi:hypothetical protein